MDVAEFSKEINAAFANVPYPTSRDFYQAIADRDYKINELTSKIKKAVDVSKEDIKKYYDFIFFLDTDGVIYYMPSYMRLIIQDDEIAQHTCVDSILMAIAKIDLDKMDEIQITVVKKFLVYCRDIIDPRLDLDTVLINEAIDHLKESPI